MTKLILGEIAHYNVHNAFSKRQEFSSGLELVANSSLLRSSLKSCNAFSISHATGIPREAVRRKIRWLQKKGWIEKDTQGGLVVTPVTSQDFEDFHREALERFMASYEQLREILEHIELRPS